jgi:dolichyl-phosphate beta-glucosyltransferase
LSRKICQGWAVLGVEKSKQKINVSVIVPLYNEESRSKHFLPELLSFCRKNLGSYEVLLVNDGSTDNTLGFISSFAKKDRHVKVVSYFPNRGKANAVKVGVFVSRGEKVLFIDADGSIQPDEIPGMVSKLDSYDVVVGTRSSPKSRVVQPPLRKMVGMTFNTYVNILFAVNVKDTLCGFKGFKREAALYLFRKLISGRWIFDVELFYRIRKQRYSLYQMPIFWVHKEGSRFKLFDPLKMALELLKLRFQLLFSRS